jgi:hypothetical protein
VKPIIGTTIVIAMLLSAVSSSYAGKDEAEQAVMEVMFGFDQIQSEHYVFTVRSDGWVDMTLDDAIVGELLTSVLKALESHPDIKGVLLTTADICSIPL